MNGYDRFVITGASGWVGRNAVDVVARQVGRAAVDRMVLSTSRARAMTAAPRAALYPLPRAAAPSSAMASSSPPLPRNQS